MNWIRAFRLHSFAQYFCTITLALFSISNTAIAAPVCRPSDQAALANCYKDDGSVKDSQLCKNADRNCNSGVGASGDSSGLTCDEAKRNAKDAYAAFNRSCGDAGMSPSACRGKVEQCNSAGGEDDYSNDQDLLVAFSEALGVPQNQLGSACPRYSGQGFIDRKDKYDKDLDTVNDDIKDTKKEIAELQDDFTESIQKIQEEIADAQKDLKQKQLDIKKDQRDRAAEQAKTSGDLAKNIRAQQSAILSGRQRIAAAVLKKNSNLIALNFDSVKYTCLTEARKFSKEYSDNMSGGGTAGSVINRATRKKNAVQNKYDTCMAQINEQRNAVVTQVDQEIETTQKAIDDAQSDIDNMNQQLSSMGSQEAEAKNDENTAIQNESNALSEKITRATSKMQSLQQSTQQKDTALKEKLQKLDRRSKEISNSLTRLGTAPDDESSNVKLSQVAGNYEDYSNAVMQISTVKGECAYNDPLGIEGASGGAAAGIKNRNNNKGAGKGVSGER